MADVHTSLFLLIDAEFFQHFVKDSVPSAANFTQITEFDTDRWIWNTLSILDPLQRSFMRQFIKTLNIFSWLISQFALIAKQLVLILVHLHAQELSGVLVHQTDRCFVAVNSKFANWLAIDSYIVETDVFTHCSESIHDQHRILARGKVRLCEIHRRVRMAVMMGQSQRLLRNQLFVRWELRWIPVLRRHQIDIVVRFPVTDKNLVEYSNTVLVVQTRDNCSWKCRIALHMGESLGLKTRNEFRSLGHRSRGIVTKRDHEVTHDLIYQFFRMSLV